MTAMAAGLALIPLALGGGKAGSEIQTPMAIVILCGLMTSTLLNMVVVPTMYLKDGRPDGIASHVEKDDDVAGNRTSGLAFPCGAASTIEQHMTGGKAS